MVVEVFTNDNELLVPARVTDIHSFREWAQQDDFPDKCRVWWLKGKVWADMSQEQIFSHVDVKSEIGAILRVMTKAERLGVYLTDGVLLSNFAGDFCGIPDGIFISKLSVAEGKVRFLEGKESGYTELQGSPDLVLEIVSRSSVRKDTVTLRQAYWEADIPEYWLVDARAEPIQFDILRRTARGYSATRKKDGWIKSAVLGKSFRLLQLIDESKLPSFTLEVE